LTNEATTRLLDPLFTTEAMREFFSDRRTLQGMLDFELALARALVATGQAPAGVLTAFEQASKADAYDIAALGRDAALAGNLAIPLLKELTARVAASNKDAAAFVHFGATSQDAIDTGRVLQIRDALQLIDEALVKIGDRLAALAQEHSATEMAGRTWLQQASPITLGLKFAGYLDAIERHRARLTEIRGHVLVVQFGGSVGTLAVLGAKGPEIAAALAKELQLALPPISWHSHRDRFAEVASTLGLIVGTAGKIARDVSLLSQTEVAEAFEPSAPSRGGSSTMPHKRNPVGSAVILSAATRVPPLVATMLAAMVQEHERGLGGWHAEWETLPEIFLLASGALYHLSVIFDGLAIDKSKMAANLAGGNGLALTEAFALALTQHEGRDGARKIAEVFSRTAVETGQSLRDVVLKDPQMKKYFSADDIDHIFNPKHFNGSAESIVAAVLAARAARKSASKSGEGKS
jgi:3-carboxy-cis,cis-muconate cycloisomerase